MTEAVSGPGPSAGRAIKQESEAFGFFDSLDILATIATQELKSKSGEKVSVIKITEFWTEKICEDNIILHC